MMREQITLMLETYRDEKILSVRNRLQDRLLYGISRTVLGRHGECAKRAVRRVLKELRENPAHVALCLSAMLQFCRNDNFGFSGDDDAELIRQIVTDTYFRQLTAEEMVVETQEGVV